MRCNGAVEMNDRAPIRAGTAGAVLAAICCAAPFFAVGLPLAGLGASWPARVVLPSMIAGVGLVAWGIHHGRAKTRT